MSFHIHKHESDININLQIREDSQISLNSYMLAWSIRKNSYKVCCMLTLIEIQGDMFL